MPNDWWREGRGAKLRYLRGINLSLSLSLSLSAGGQKVGWGWKKFMGPERGSESLNRRNYTTHSRHRGETRLPERNQVLNDISPPWVWPSYRDQNWHLPAVLAVKTHTNYDLSFFASRLTSDFPRSLCVCEWVRDWSHGDISTWLFSPSVIWHRRRLLLPLPPTQSYSVRVWYLMMKKKMGLSSLTPQCPLTYIVQEFTSRREWNCLSGFLMKVPTKPNPFRPLSHTHTLVEARRRKWSYGEKCLSNRRKTLRSRLFAAAIRCVTFERLPAFLVNYLAIRVSMHLHIPYIHLYSSLYSVHLAIIIKWPFGRPLWQKRERWGNGCNFLLLLLLASSPHSKDRESREMWLAIVSPATLKGKCVWHCCCVFQKAASF